MNIRKLLLFLLSSFIFWGSFITTFTLNFNKSLPFEIIVASILDWFLTIFVVFIVLSINKSILPNFNIHMSINVKKIFEKYIYILYILVLLTFLFVFQRLDLILLGITREELVFNEDNSRYIMLLSSFFVLTSAVAISYNYKKRIKLLLLIGTLLICIYNLSRSEIQNLLLIILICQIIMGVSLKKILFFSLFSLLTILTVCLLTIYQGRADSIATAFNNLLNSFFKYKAFSFYLSEYSINKIKDDIEQILYPFLGFSIEKFLSIIEPVTNPISVQDSNFISTFRSLGTTNAFDANVLYPWWSWFYGLFGIIGIFIKAIYCFIILWCLSKSKLYFLFLYVLFLFLILSFFRHPLLNADSVYAIASIFLLDIFLIITIKKNNNQHIN